MGLMVQRGWGVESNATIAVHWYQKAADQGDSEGLFNLGVNYARAESVIRDYQKSLEFYRRAAAKGHLPAMHNIGMAYLEALGPSWLRTQLRSLQSNI